MTTSSSTSRRDFLKRSSVLPVALAASPWALNLAAIGQAAAQSGPADYKALVCVFLYGGNDHGNTLVPYDTANYGRYQNLRKNLATPYANLAATVLRPEPGLQLPGSAQYALAPQLQPLIKVFNDKRLGLLLNVGPLLQPTSKEEYLNRSVPLPPTLFSHNDQQSVWQASQPEGASSGWGGRIADLFAASNKGSVFSAVSVFGNAVYLSGLTTAPYQVSSAGVVSIKGLGGSLYGSTTVAQALQAMASSAPDVAGLLAQQHANIVKRSISAGDQLRLAIGDASALPTVFPKTELGLGAQLEMVARIIKARSSLSPSPKRQVFFVGLGGFDTHDELAAQHPALLTELGICLAAFDQDLVAQGVDKQVTTFTASDFGRTMASNGDGSDHGWGGHHFVMGGAVQGGRYFGTAPTLSDGKFESNDDIGQGRLLPTTAVDQLAATLATWMGVSATDLRTVVPNIGSYTETDLKFFMA